MTGSDFLHTNLGNRDVNTRDFIVTKTLFSYVIDLIKQCSVFLFIHMASQVKRIILRFLLPSNIVGIVIRRILSILLILYTVSK